MPMTETPEHAVFSFSGFEFRLLFVLWIYFELRISGFVITAQREQCVDSCPAGV
jgi:hypothetical protein